jgi:tRNA modification GTPase
MRISSCWCSKPAFHFAKMRHNCRNKIDLDTDGMTENALPIAEVATSAVTGQGIEDLRSALLDLVRAPVGESESGILTNLRQHEAVTAALAGLAAARTGVAERVPHEMLLLDLYSALRQLDGLTGETTADDILNRIFSTFCIGK